MLDFSNTMNNHHFALNDVELRILQPVFLEFHAKTGLSIDEYGDTRLIPQNLELLINLANDYIKTLDKQSMKIVIEFIKNLRPMIIDKNTIWVSGDLNIGNKRMNCLNGQLFTNHYSSKELDMNKGNTIEDFFCKQFIKSGYQDRFFFELSSNKKRVKAISRICHNMMDIINENKIVEVYNSTDLIHLTDRLRELSKEKEGYCIGFFELDQKWADIQRL